MRRHRLLALLPLVAILGACQAVVLHPAGEIAGGQRDLLIETSALILLIIVPVMVLTVLFAWRYRASNEAARYRPDWEHSIHLELVIWAAPLLVIICLGALTWVGTHLLDPYRPACYELEDESRFRWRPPGGGQGALVPAPARAAWAVCGRRGARR